MFAEYYRKKPENLFTTPEEKFDFMLNGKFAFSLVYILSVVTIINHRNTIMMYFISSEWNTVLHFSGRVEYKSGLLQIYHF